MLRPLLGGTACLLAAAVPASAHVIASPDTGAPGAMIETSFTVVHGCSGKATVELDVQIPDSVTFAKPRVKPGWTITVKPRIAAKPGEVAEIDWRGGPLPNALYDRFEVMLKLPDTPGATLYFPAVQHCGDVENRWIQIPAAGQKWHDVPRPAPFIALQAKVP